MKRGGFWFSPNGTAWHPGHYQFVANTAEIKRMRYAYADNVDQFVRYAFDETTTELRYSIGSNTLPIRYAFSDNE